MLSEQIPNPSPLLPFVSWPGGGREKRGETPVFPRMCLQSIAYAHRRAGTRRRRKERTHISAPVRGLYRTETETGRTWEKFPRFWAHSEAQSPARCSISHVRASCKHSCVAGVGSHVGQSGGGVWGQVSSRGLRFPPPTPVSELPSTACFLSSIKFSLPAACLLGVLPSEHDPKLGNL